MINDGILVLSIPSSQDLCSVSDEALVEYVVLGKSDAAFEELKRRMESLIFRRAKKYYSVNGYTRDDIIQEGIIALYNATLSFDPSRGYRFRTYFSSYIYLHYKRIFFNRNVRKKDPLFHCKQVEYYDPDLTDEAIFDGVDGSPLENVLKNELHEALMNAIDSDLTDLEKKIVIAYLEGRDYENIADKYDVSTKSVDNALQRARKKLRLSLCVNFSN